MNPSTCRLTQCIAFFFVSPERESELQATIDQLDATLEEQQEEATSAIAGWESHCQAVEEKNSKLEKELQIALAARDEASSGLKSENVSPNNRA